MHAARLTGDHEEELETLLEQDPVQNLFLLGFLDGQGVDRSWWFGAFDDEETLRAATLVMPRRLAVPWAPDSTAAGVLGEALLRRFPPSMMVGPRAAVDGIWAVWRGGVVPERYYDQRLYVCERPMPGDDPPGFRLARPEEAEAVAEASGRMEEEDLGRNPYADDPGLYAAVVRDRIRRGRTWVIEENGELVFQINVGTTTAWGCQVGGTWVPPRHRGRGLATAGMRALGRRLLPRHRRITLHVNEANTPAVRVYEASGYVVDAPFRLIMVPA